MKKYTTKTLLVYYKIQVIVIHNLIFKLPYNFIALAQILLAISAIEVFTASIAKFSSRPGDFSWDPFQIRPESEDKLNELQTKELKNGRLAMLSVAGMAYQTYLTGQGPLEQLQSGHISPFGDGQGVF